MGEGKTQEQALGQCYGMYRGARDAWRAVNRARDAAPRFVPYLLRVHDALQFDQVGKKILFPFGEAVICEVDGTAVREIYTGFPDYNDPMGFVLGGHHYRYPWIPEPEIWIVRQSPVRDKVAVGFFHEPSERLAMKYHGVSYDDAHTYLADMMEHAFRQMVPEEAAARLEAIWLAAC